MNILEKDIETLVFESLLTDPKILEERGLFLYPNCLRQIKLGSYGIADLLCFNVTKPYKQYWEVRIQIVELKKELIETSTLLQASRYETAIRRFLSHLKKKRNLKHIGLDITYVLIGRIIQETGDFVFLINGIGGYKVKVYTYELDIIKGLRFTEHSDWYRTTEAFGGLEEEVMSEFLPALRECIRKEQAQENEVAI